MRTIATHPMEYRVHLKIPFDVIKPVAPHMIITKSAPIYARETVCHSDNNPAVLATVGHEE